MISYHGSGPRAGWTKEHVEAIERLAQRLHRSRHAAGLENSDDDTDDDTDDEDEEKSSNSLSPAERKMLRGASKQTRALDAHDFVLHNKMLLRAGAFSTKGRDLRRSYRAYELENKITSCRRHLENEEYQKVYNPGPSRRERAILRRERQQKLLVMIHMVRVASIMETGLRQRRMEKRTYLHRTMTAMKIQSWFRRNFKGKRDHREAEAFIVIRRFVRVTMATMRLKAMKRSADMIKYFFEHHATQSVSNLIGKFRNKIIRGQRCWKSYSKITKARMIVLQKLWDLEEQRLHDGERERKAKEKREQLEFEASLISDAGAGKGGYDIAAKVLNATKRRHRQNNVKIDETGSREEEETATKGVESNAMHLLHQRTKRVLESTKFHTTIQMNVPDHLAASPSVRTALLTNLLRQKRLKYQEKLDNVTRRLIAKRQTTVQLNIEDVRRFLHSGGDDGDYEYNVVTHVEEEEEDNSKYTGFLMLQSLEEGEIKQLVAKGIQMTSGFIVVDEPKSPSSKTKKR